jgi:opacity protein-like surface antigen
LKTLLALSVSVIFVVCCAQAQQAQQGTQQPAAQPDAQQPPAQQPPAPPPTPGSSSSSSSSSAPTAPKERFITGGLTASFLGLSLIPKRTFTDNNSTEIQTQYQTTGASSRFGYGLTLQVHVKGHYYVDLSGILQRMGYQETTTVATTVTAVLNGATYPSTTTTSTHEDTRARLIDIPILARYYGTGKRPSSPRWFLEAGPSYHFLNDIRTSMDSTDDLGNVTCCTTTAAKPKDRSAIGATVGAGIRFIDEFGIKVTPEFRYTRWKNPLFESLSTTGNANQIEGDISITF